MLLSFAPMPRGAFTGFQMIFLFALSLFAGSGKWMQSVSACPMNEADGHTAGQTGKNDCCRPVEQVPSDRKHSYFLCCGLPFSRSGDVFFLLVIPFLRIFPWSFFYTICLCFRLPPFCAFQWAASVSHFRSGRKGNSGIGRESKVKPPVFGKNLQPCG